MTGRSQLGVAETPAAEREAVEAPDSRTTAWRDSAIAWLRLLAGPIAVYLASRLVVVGAAAVAGWYEKKLTLTTALTGWDSSWYLDIARNGYPPTVAAEGPGNRWAFFPALPEVVRWVQRATGMSFEHAGIAVAFVFGLTAAIAVWFAVRSVFDSRIADRTVAMVCFFPTAYTFSMVYTEGLFLTTAALCLYFLHTRRWLLAGAAACVAGLTRNVGVVLVLAVLVVGAQAVLRRRDLRALGAMAIAPLGVIGWVLFQWHRTGSPVSFLRAQAAWDQQWTWFTSPFQALWRVLTAPHGWSNAGDVLGAAAVVFLLVTIGMLVHLQVRGRGIPVAWWIYTIGGALAALSPFWPSSVPRYVMVVFPLLAVVALRLPRRYDGALLGGMAVLQGALATVAFVSIITWQTAPFAP